MPRFCILNSVPLPEKALIDRIRRNISSARASQVIRGIGDDCAVLRLPTNHDALVTTDFTLEGVHFRRAWHSPEIVGRRCLTRGLSDIAAMGGDPVALFLSLAIPKQLPQSWVDRFMKGFMDLARDFHVPLAGGDTAQSPAGVLADIIVLGSVPRGLAILRSTARAGDRIYVTGELGGAAAALEDLRKRSIKVAPRDYPRHFHPIPQVAIGRFLCEKKLVSSMIDLSDGLSTDLAHICAESRVGARIEEDLIPRATVGRPARGVSMDAALHGGEDYELLFTAPKLKRIPARILGVPITSIGEITRNRSITLLKDGARCKLESRGWEHVRN
jgi:thiamine-monophosphate kinase